jgi:quercetin dioxygenase-like cupin family protein
MMLAVALAASVSPGLALAAPLTSALAAPGAPAQADAEAPPAGVRIAMRQQVLPPGGTLPEHRQAGERYLYVVSGRLKVSDLVTGAEQVVEAGKMAAEAPGDWHVAQALGTDPVTLYVIDRTPAAAGSASAGGGGGN